MPTPRATILIPVYNSAKYLALTLDSVLSQSFSDFEVLAINDGSSDNCADILRSYKDSRIRLIDHSKNLGLIATLNEGLEKARGEYILRIDGDDICLPGRFSTQIAFMDAHPKIAAASGWAKIIDETGKETGTLKTYTGRRLQYNYWKPSPLIHPATIIRRKAVGNKRFASHALHSEDYEFWFDWGREGKLANIPEYLIFYRVHSEGVSVSSRTTQLKSACETFNKKTSLHFTMPEFRSFFDNQSVSISDYLKLQKKVAEKLNYPWDQRTIDLALYCARAITSSKKKE